MNKIIFQATVVAILAVQQMVWAGDEIKDSGPGILPKQATVFGANPDGKGTILRLWEQAGVSGEVTVSLPKGMKASRMTPVNLRGEVAGKTESISRDNFTIDLTAFAPASFVLESETSASPRK